MSKRILIGIVLVCLILWAIPINSGVAEELSAIETIKPGVFFEGTFDQYNYGTYPMIMEITAVDGLEFNGILHWPELGDSKTKFRGKINPTTNQIWFTEYEQIQGSSTIVLNGDYYAELEDNSLSGYWNWPSGAKGGDFSILSNTPAENILSTIIKPGVFFEGTFDQYNYVTYPMIMEITAVDGLEFNGILHWPELGDSKTKFRGRIYSTTNQIWFTEYEQIQGSSIIVLNGDYYAELEDNRLSGYWNWPSGAKGGVFSITPTPTVSPTPTMAPTPTPTLTPTTPPITTTPLLHPTNGPLKVEFEKITSKILKIHIENPGPYFVYIPSSTKEGDTNFKISGITWGGKLEAYVESTHPHERWTIYAKDVYKDVKLPVTLVLIVLNPPKSAIEVAKMAGPMLLKSATGIDPIGETLDRFINYALEQKTESFILFTKCFLYCKHPTTKNIEPKESDQFAGGISKSCFAIVTHGVILSPIIYNKAAYNDYKNKYDLPKKGAGYVLLPESRLVIELTYEEIREDKLGLMIKEYQALRGSRGTGRSDDLEYTLLHIYQGNYEGSEHVHSMVRSGTTFDYYSFDSISSISITPSIPPEIDFNILLKPDKPTYRRGETAQVTIDVTNNRDQDTEIWLGTTFKYPTLKDPKDIPLKRAVIPKGKTKSFDDIEWTIPPDAPLGQYEIAVNCYKDAGQNEYYTDNIVWAPIFNVDMITPVLDVPPEQKARENVEDALGALASMPEAYYGFMELIYELSEVEPPEGSGVKFEYHVLSARFCNNIAEAQTYMSSGGIESADMNDALELVRELELAKEGFCIVIVDYSFMGFGEYESGTYPIVCNEKGDPFWESWQFYEMIKEEIEVGYKEYEG